MSIVNKQFIGLVYDVYGLELSPFELDTHLFLVSISAILSL